MNETVGNIFKQAREERGVELSEAAARTHIKVQQLEFIEKDAFDRLPAIPYTRGFIKSYARYLGLNPDEMIQAFEDQFVSPPPEPEPEPEPVMEPTPVPEPPQPLEEKEPETPPLATAVLQTTDDESPTPEASPSPEPKEVAAPPPSSPQKKSGNPTQIWGWVKKSVPVFVGVLIVWGLSQFFGGSRSENQETLENPETRNDPVSSESQPVQPERTPLDSAPITAEEKLDKLDPEYRLLELPQTPVLQAEDLP